jgi:hypothetical protein
MMNITDAMTDDDEDDHYWLSEEDNANIVMSGWGATRSHSTLELSRS